MHLDARVADSDTERLAASATREPDRNHHLRRTHRLVKASIQAVVDENDLSERDDLEIGVKKSFTPSKVFSHLSESATHPPVLFIEADKAARIASR
jgi:hypothetical protein